MSAVAKRQCASGERGPAAGAMPSSAGVNASQPVVFERESGEQMRFSGVSAFLAFWLVEQRHKKQEQANA